MKFNIIVADPPWNFSDSLTMNAVKRGSSSNYRVLKDEDIIGLDVKSIVADDAVLVLWVPSSKLQAGLDTMKAWGFEQTQTFIWVKTKKSDSLFKELKQDVKEGLKTLSSINKLPFIYEKICNLLDSIDLNESLNFFMGRLFRQTHEVALVGKRGKIYKDLKNRAQRSVLLSPALGHSSKPDALQDRLEVMFPTGKKLEIFARRVKIGWECVGDEISLLKEDIRDSIKRLKNEKNN